MTQPTTAPQAATKKTAQPTTTCCIPPMIAAFHAAEMAGLGRGCEWKTTNPLQERFLHLFGSHRNAVSQMPEIKSMAATDAATINSWLKGHGYNIILAPFPPNTFGVASIMDVLVRWLQAGKPCIFDGQDGNKYDGVHLKDGVLIRNDGHGCSIAKVRTQNNDEVCMAVGVEPYNSSPYSILDRAFQMKAHFDRLSGDGRFTGVKFPMVSLDQKVDVSWLVGMNCTDHHGLPVEVTQAVQQTHFRMNEIGARAQSAVAVAVAMTRDISPGPLVIDRPFLLWIERPGIEIPLFAAWISYDAWRNPGSIE